MNHTLRISAGMTAARADIARRRSARDAARDAEGRVVAAYNAGHSSIEAVHAAEAATASEEARLAEARRSFAEAREKYEPRFMDSLAPVVEHLRGEIRAIADRLDAALAPAREADGFAIANALPVPQTVASTRRLAAIAAELRKTANG